MDKPCILVVEDELLSREILTDALERNGYLPVGAPDLASAIQALETRAGSFDAVLLDRMLPDGDGLDLLQRMKDLPCCTDTPVIMQSAMTANEDIIAGLAAGAFYYLTKPFEEETLLAIVRSAVADHRIREDLRQQLDKTTHTMANLDEACFRFRTPDEARNIAALIANACPDPERVVLGLSELMLNAVEHGNLGITYADKSRLLASDALHDEIDARLKQPAFSARIAEIRFQRNINELVFMIRDQGDGFDWLKYVEFSPERAFDTHGRGIAMSRMISFDRMEYQGNGNAVEVAIRAS